MRRQGHRSYARATTLLSTLGFLGMGCSGGLPDSDETSASGGGNVGVGASPGVGGMPGAGGTGDDPDLGPDPGTGGSSGGGDGAGGSNPKLCEPGISSTSQIPRLLNREYDAAVKDLVGLTALSNAAGNAPSSLLVEDFTGSLTDIAWSAYLLAAENIAEEVMSGADPSQYMSCEPTETGCYEETIRNFGRRAFRRPLTEIEVQSFLRLTTVEPQGTPEEIAEVLLFAILASPSFIMRPELAQEAEGAAFMLSSHEVAARLSFLIWGTIPDETLDTAADAGELGSSAEILAQAERMILDREKTASTVALFHRHYLAMGEDKHWGQVDHDTSLYPDYSPNAVAPMMEELDRFFETVALDGGSFEDLFLSDMAFVNEDTAALYEGLDPADFGPELEQVQLDGALRPGFLTRAGFLASFSSHTSTSPILRGAFISTRILGTVLGPPPPGAGETPIPEGEYTTYRQAVEEQTAPISCVQCHSTYINPTGFVLERFNSVGQYQETDPMGGAIDGSADVFFNEENIQTITSPLQLMTELGTGPDARRHYAEQWVRFVTGRAPNSNDACTVETLDSRLSQDGYTILNLLTDLTQTESFRLRTVGN